MRALALLGMCLSCIACSYDDVASKKQEGDDPFAGVWLFCADRRCIDTADEGIVIVSKPNEVRRVTYDAKTKTYCPGELIAISGYSKSADYVVVELTQTGPDGGIGETERWLRYEPHLTRETSADGGASDSVLGIPDDLERVEAEPGTSCN